MRADGNHDDVGAVDRPTHRVRGRELQAAGIPVALHQFLEPGLEDWHAAVAKCAQASIAGLDSDDFVSPLGKRGGSHQPHVAEPNN